MIIRQVYHHMFFFLLVKMFLGSRRFQSICITAVWVHRRRRLHISYVLYYFVKSLICHESTYFVWHKFQLERKENKSKSKNSEEKDRNYLMLFFLSHLLSKCNISNENHFKCDQFHYSKKNSTKNIKGSFLEAVSSCFDDEQKTPGENRI